MVAGTFRGIVIGLGLCVVFIGMIGVFLGGAGLMSKARINSRAGEIEKKMLERIPANTPAAQRKLVEKRTKILAKTAAEMEFANKALNNRF